MQLGAIYSKYSTQFLVWAPKANTVELCLYKAGNACEPYEIIEMNKGDNSIWTVIVQGDLDRVYYTYKIDNFGKIQESHDPYAKACGVNGHRSMVIDLAKTNPEGFELDKGPVCKNLTDIIVTEISVADTTADTSCQAVNKGKYLGLTERNLTNTKGYKTGLDHIVESGVTHVQLMPAYDFASIDEASDEAQYNWGYDPYNYNIPEGSYSTDPFHGEVRIREFKEMIKAIHTAGLGVIMDVVYNHTYDVDGSCFQRTAPDEFYRKDGDRYSDASACGNEVASDRPMVRKYIIDSLCYWVKEYHIDGFRFDLMGVLDIETMNLAYEELVKIKPDIIMYGEGWTGGSSTLSEEKRAMKKYVGLMPGVGVFSDDIRDAVKGHVFDLNAPGFVNGGLGFEDRIKDCVLGGISAKPGDMVNYVSCHDNLTLWDKLTITNPEDTLEDRLAMNRMAATIVFTSQGIPFFLQGEEFARTKNYKGQLQENSYNLPIEVNSLKYDQLDEYIDLYNYYRGLIDFRKNHKALRLNAEDRPKDHISFIDTGVNNLVAFTISAHDEKLLVIYNANRNEVRLDIPEGLWEVYIRDDISGNSPIGTIKNQADIKGLSCLVAVSN